MSKIESKIKSAEDWVKEYRQEEPLYSDLLLIIQAAQRQAIGATLEVATSQVSGWPSVCKLESEIIDDIRLLIDSPELKVI